MQILAKYIQIIESRETSDIEQKRKKMGFYILTLIIYANQWKRIFIEFKLLFKIKPFIKLYLINKKKTFKGLNIYNDQ